MYKIYKYASFSTRNLIQITNYNCISHMKSILVIHSQEINNQLKIKIKFKVTFK